MILKQLIIVIIVVFNVIYPVLSQHRSRRPLPVFRDTMAELLLPNNATAIRENIVDTFSCENRIYGYYADIDNECQVFHVCLPQERGARRWSFICPFETVFNQATFVCTRLNDSIPCEESEQYYVLNEEFGKEENPEDNSTSYPIDYENELPPAPTPFSRNPRGKGKSLRRGKSNKKNNNEKGVKSDKRTESPKLVNVTTTLRPSSDERIRK